MDRPKNKNEYREQLAQMFINSLSEHGLSWKKQWKGVGISSPFNAITKARYKGCNQMFLYMVSMNNGYKDPRWVTMVQIMDKNEKYHPGEKWHLKKGSKAVYVEYWFPYDLENKKALTWSEYKALIDAGRNEEDFTLNTRYTAVFNADNVEGMPELTIQHNNDIKQEDLVSTLSKNMDVPIYYDGDNKAYYSPGEDAIHLPEPSVFDSSYAFNSTALHELAHSTGHSSRLDRSIKNIFGTEAYAFEELIAEMASCFMSANFTSNEEKESNLYIDNHKAYVQSWIKAIHDKPDMLVKAIKEAQTAAAYMDLKAEIIDIYEYDNIVGNMKVANINNTTKVEYNDKHNNEREEKPAYQVLKRESIRDKVARLERESKEHETLEEYANKKRMGY